MDRAVHRVGATSPPIFTFLAILLQVMIAAGGLYEWRGERPTLWLFMATNLLLFASFLPHLSRNDAAKGGGHVAPVSDRDAHQSDVDHTGVDQTLDWLWGLLIPATTVFGLGMAAREGFARLLEAVWPNSSLTARVNSVSAEAIGAGAAATVVAVTLLWRAVQRLKSKTPRYFDVGARVTREPLSRMV